MVYSQRLSQLWPYKDMQYLKEVAWLTYNLAQWDQHNFLFPPFFQWQSMVTYLRKILMSSMPQKKSPKTLPMPQYSPLIKFSMEQRLSLMTLTRAQNELSRTLPMPQFTSAETFTMERRLSSKTSTRVQSESSLTLTDLQNMSPLEATISESGPS